MANGNLDSLSIPSTMPTHMGNAMGLISHNHPRLSRKRNLVEVSIHHWRYLKCAQSSACHVSGTRTPVVEIAECNTIVESFEPSGTSNGRTPRTEEPGSISSSRVGS